MRTKREVSMKNKIAITTIMLLVVCLALAFVSCKGTFDAPTNLAMSGNVLSWQAVEGAESYEIEVKNLGTFETKNTMYFIEVEETGTYEIRVRAKKGDVYSAYSDAYVYVVDKMLDAPVASFALETKTVSWNAIEGAAGYVVRVINGDESLTLDDAVIEMSEVSGTSYKLEKEEYSNPGKFVIQVKAIAPEGSEFSDSAYSDACTFTNDAQLSTPVLTSVTSTRVYWNSVANATAYYLEARNTADPDEVYSTTVNASAGTSVSVLLTNFNIETPGIYTVHIKTVGDGEVYKDSAFSDVNEDFKIYKLPQLAEDCLKLVENADGTTSAVWRIEQGEYSEEQIGLINYFTLVLTPYDSEGNAVLSAKRVSFNLESDSDKEKLTIVEGTGYTEYSYVIDQQFYETDEDGNTNLLLNIAYYGKRYTAELSATRNGNGVMAGTSVTAAEQYLSYKKPGTDKDSGAYLITSAAELAYIAKEPDASYKLGANIDFGGYEWLCIDSFSGTFDGTEYVISDIVIIGDGANVGLFGEIASGARVSNLRLLNAVVDSETAQFAGIIAGINNGTISDSVVTGSVNAKYATAGAVVGQNNGTLTTSQSVADVTAAIAGGIAGINDEGAILSYSNARGTVKAVVEEPEEGETSAVKNSYAGGFVAVNKGTVLYSSSIGNVSAVSAIKLDAPNYAGGFVALNEGTITGSYAGANYSEDYSKRNKVSASGRNENNAVGGFAGYNAGAISESYANVNASSPNYVGGFVGFNAEGASVSDSYSIGGVTVNTNNVGGFSGNSAGTFDNVYYYDKDLGDDANRKDKEVSQYVDDFGAGLAEKLGGNFTTIGGEHSVANVVLKGHVYNVTTSLTIGPGAKITATVQYVDNSGALQTITAGNESATGSLVCGNQNTEGTVVIVFSNGSYRGLVIVTID